ncbi:hypothetical protein [Hymenobacter mucosus]|uniref:Uncharacterized protein n=1 Tax=Hymenobacter mucosus TaxID=1411120 RepID=A0A238W6U8_9BACT|nr:hypothetical protein [Hymenobacter mucosus]SNR41913.1 hypothetical protein SAMN06269173_102257 [Hymenobacter mucosus]
MTFLPLLLTVAGGLFCVGCVASLAFLLTWRDFAATPPERTRRHWWAVLPGTALLLGLLLWTLLHVMLLWTPNAAPVAFATPAP